MQDMIKTADRLASLLTEEVRPCKVEIPRKRKSVKLFIGHKMAIHLIHDDEKTVLLGLNGEAIMREEDFHRLEALGLLTGGAHNG